MNKHLSDQRKAEHGKAEETPIMAGAVERYVDELYLPGIREMFGKQECLWDVAIGEINVTEK